MPRLILELDDGRRYAVESIDADPGRYRRIDLTRRIPGIRPTRAITCEAEPSGYDPRRTTADGRTCDCEAFRPEDGCDHLTALESVGLLKPFPGAQPLTDTELTELDAETRAEGAWEAATGR